MPPPSCCSKVNARSDNDFENSKSDISNSEEDFQLSLRTDTVGIVKSLLGPSLEDAVLRTLEFGRSLMQKQDLDVEQFCRDKKLVKKIPKEITDCSNNNFNLEVLLEERDKSPLKGILNKSNGKEKRLFDFSVKLEGDELSSKPSSLRKIANVSKIRSLDSDLKQCAPSPEKIKKQLEALIQINKDEPPDHSWNLLSPKITPIPVEMAIMPSLCMYKNETDTNCSSSCDLHSQTSKAENGCCSESKMKCSTKKKLPSKICQAPEFLSNALGPTIDVSIIDNLKMMRDIFKNDSGKGEGCMNQQVKHEVRLQNSEGEMTCRIEELQRKIEELEQKEQCLIKQIEEEEHDRECKRRAFEEERKMLEARMCSGTETKKKESCKSVGCGRADSKSECLQTKIANEEEKLSRLKLQQEQFQREIAEAKCKKQALKKNKCLLDAWDIFASRVCHTRLPSFSRAYNLERKSFKPDDSVNIHCCFPGPPSPPPPNPCCKKSSSKLRCKSAHSRTDMNKESESQTHIKCKIKMGEIQFPIQRDIACGLHQMLKTCTCTSKSAMRVTAQLASSEDELSKKCKGNCKKKCSSSLGIESSAEMILRRASGDKRATRSKSDTSLKCLTNDKCSKIVKVMWAVARINIFQNNYRTYEIMDATCTPPHCPPAKTEGIFVVKSPQKKCCPPPPRPKCSPCATQLH